jgi:hypothetical protein
VEETPPYYYGGNKMLTKDDLYRCYSVNLMQFLSKNNIKYILVAKDIVTNKKFYVFEKTDEFLDAFKQWELNNPKK